jgi:hypothetical protein
MKSIWLLPFVVLALHATDFSGKWTGRIEISDPNLGDKITTAVKAEFEQKDASAVSGKIGRGEEEETPEPIKNAKLDGNHLVFEVQTPEATTPIKFNLILVSDGHIEGEMQGAVDIGKISGKVFLNKSK